MMNVLAVVVLASSILALPALARTSLTAQVDTDSLRFVTSDLEVARVGIGESVPGHLAGELVVDFVFQVPGQGDGQLPDFDVAHRFVGPVSTELDGPGMFGGWLSSSESAAEVSIKRFSASTDGGVATISIPVRESLGAGYRAMGIPAGDVRCEVALSIDGPMSVDSDGILLGADDWLTLDVHVDYPAAWVEVPSGAVPVAGSATLLLMTAESASTSRSFGLAVSPPGMLSIHASDGSPIESMVDVGPELLGTHLLVEGLSAGDASVDLLDSSGTVVSTSIVVVSDSFAGDADLSATGEPARREGHAPLASSASSPITVSPGSVSDTGQSRKCQNASVHSYGNFHRICGDCGLDPQIPDSCDTGSVSYAYTPGRCLSAILKYCSKASDLQQKAPTYAVDTEYEETTNGCWWVKVTVEGDIAGVASAGVDGAVQLSKFCCILKQVPKSDWVTLTIEDCQTTGFGF